MIECFLKKNKLSLSLLNETWLYKNDPQAKKLLLDIKQEHGVEFIRRDRDSRGGGVTIAFDSKLISLKKLNLDSLKKKKRI